MESPFTSHLHTAAAWLRAYLMPAISASAAEYVAQICESTLHGVYTVLFFIAIYLLLFRRKMTRVNAAMLAVILIMYSLSTTAEVLSVQQKMANLLSTEKAASHSEVFDKSSDKTYITNLYIEVTNMIIGDCVVVWRTWVLYDRRTWFMVISGCLLCGTAVCGLGLSHKVSVNGPGTSLFGGSIAVWGLMTISMTIITNVWATVLMAWRACAHALRVRKLLGHNAPKNRYIGIVLLITESGAVYALTWLVCAITQATGTNGVIVVTDILIQLTGIYPTLVVVLVCLRATQQDAITQFEATSRSGSANATETPPFQRASPSTRSLWANGGSSNERFDRIQSEKRPVQGYAAPIAIGVPSDLNAGPFISDDSIITLKELGAMRDDAHIENGLQQGEQMH